ncbi:MAG: 50S ribosomal protein L22 [Thermoprotei archaeon]|nr:MAG: 50S ribosomal protein L22 [Thermoprotei archaeon]RLF01075.1 MAG: 50S ribosomal protein L22 [Thermoprotei archaeon]
MTRWHFSRQDLDPVRTATAAGRDLRISYKHAVEICRFIKNRKLDEAKKILENVIELKQGIPFRTYKKKVPHHKAVDKWPAVRWPVKAAKAILKVLENAENNAINKGLDVSRLYVVHAAAHKSIKIRKYIPRAFGRATPYFQQLVHVEIAVEER